MQKLKIKLQIFIFFRVIPLWVTLYYSSMNLDCISGYSLPQDLEAGQHFGEDQSVWDIPCCNKQIKYEIPRYWEHISLANQYKN